MYLDYYIISDCRYLNLVVLRREKNEYCHYWMWKSG